MSTARRRPPSTRRPAGQAASRAPRARSKKGGAGRTRRPLGQHFLTPPWAARLVERLAPEPGDVFLEIGSGGGALTLPLAATGAPILAVDIDRQLVETLASRVPRNVTVLHGDILELDVIPYLTGLVPQQAHPGSVADAPRRRFRAAGNLPYYIASPILFHLIELHRRHRLFADATVMVQREVADRLVARPGTRDYRVLTVLLSVHARVSRVLDLPPSAFQPPPKVHSSVVRLEFGPPAVRLPDERLFERLVKAMFSQRRKMLGNALKGFHPAMASVLAASGLDLRRRPETLDLDEIARLAERLAAAVHAPVL
jgi:16S rRNA (adenine1518-N6/adenine1519-N6)-dimethyltransferase